MQYGVTASVTGIFHLGINHVRTPGEKRTAEIVLTRCGTVRKNRTTGIIVGCNEGSSVPLCLKYSGKNVPAVPVSKTVRASVGTNRIIPTVRRSSYAHEVRSGSNRRSIKIFQFPGCGNSAGNAVPLETRLERRPGSVERTVMYETASRGYKTEIRRTDKTSER